MDNTLKMTADEYIRFLFENTENGFLQLEEDACRLDWDLTAMEQLLRQFRQLREMLDEIANTAQENWSPALQAVWDTYLKPYPDHGMDEQLLFDISMKIDLDEPLTQEEEVLSEKRRDWMRTHALTRLPHKRCNPASLIQRVRRYARLMELRAPGLVAENEARCLARELVLYNHLVS